MIAPILFVLALASQVATYKVVFKDNEDFDSFFYDEEDEIIYGDED